MTDERRVEVAAEAPKWADLFGADPNFTLGMDASRYLTHNRGECPDDVPCALCLLERATAALDAHDGDLRERLAGAVEARARDHAYVVGETADAPATNNPLQRGRDEGIQIAYRECARLIRNRP